MLKARVAYTVVSEKNYYINSSASDPIIKGSGQ